MGDRIMKWVLSAILFAMLIPTIAKADEPKILPGYKRTGMFIEEPDTTLQDKYVKETVLQVNWGKGNGMLGKIDNDEGPLGICVNDKGNIYILDNVNKRIVVYNNDGKYIKGIKLKGLPDGLTHIFNKLFWDDGDRFGIADDKQHIFYNDKGIKVKEEKDNKKGYMHPVALEKVMKKYGNVGFMTTVDKRHFIADTTKKEQVQFIVNLPGFMSSNSNIRFIAQDTYLSGLDDKGNVYIDNDIIYFDKTKENKIWVAYVLKYDPNGVLIGKINKNNLRSISWIMPNGNIYLLEYDYKSEIGPQINKWTLKDTQ
jgi:hypothetical protein